MTFPIKTLLAIGGASLLLAACDQPKPAPVAEAPAPAAKVKKELSPAAKAAALAASIEAEPSRADELLQAAGLSREEFEAQLFDIARDPEAAAEYEASR